jgi:hypothetical protein
MLSLIDSYRTFIFYGMKKIRKGNGKGRKCIHEYVKKIYMLCCGLIETFQSFNINTQLEIFICQNKFMQQQENRIFLEKK